MSTRCHVAICRNANEREEGKALHMYHHCDGYPSGVGSELSTILKKCPKPWTPESVQKFINETDDDYEIVEHGVGWDNEYVYIIDCEAQKLRGYYKGITSRENIGFDIRWPGDEIIIPCNSFSDEGFDYEERHHTAFVLAIECLNQHGWFNREKDLREVYDFMEKHFFNER